MVLKSSTVEEFLPDRNDLQNVPLNVLMWIDQIKTQGLASMPGIADD